MRNTFLKSSVLTVLCRVNKTIECVTIECGFLTPLGIMEFYEVEVRWQNLTIRSKVGTITTISNRDSPHTPGEESSLLETGIRKTYIIGDG